MDGSQVFSALFLRPLLLPGGGTPWGSGNMRGQGVRGLLGLLCLLVLPAPSQLLPPRRWCQCAQLALSFRLAVPRGESGELGWPQGWGRSLG